VTAELDIGVTRQADAVRVRLTGDLDGRAATTLLSLWPEASAPGARSLRIDVSGLRRMDGRGLSALVRLSAGVRSAGGAFAIGGAGAELRGILNLCGLLGGLGVAVAETEDAGRWAPSAQWARPMLAMRVKAVPAGAVSLNVDGRRPVGPLLGFGRLWQKVYRVRLPAAKATPDQALAALKDRLPVFQPPASHFFLPLAGVQPGEVILINAQVLGMPVFTGVMVLFADATSFTLITPQGHPESGWVTFGVSSEQGETVVEVESLARASDPVYEFGLRVLGAAGIQEGIWRHVLTSLAGSFGARAEVEMTRILVDGKVQWGQAANVGRNAQLWSLLATVTGRARPGARANSGPVDG
jgi:anti-anti-sigma factor